ncbi:universal stress protein family [Synechococcus sp. JA-2-3B'a(2-13)]|uniref:universal stress protein n=1 Tax=Synechococcus sp. (strain JA-2-3B'a(2-13)) TaxID=321332 RepID=UPI0000694FA4|nr:universal stress protein family [Synechococcus sp. JA-2-3B'a(2-13)]
MGQSRGELGVEGKGVRGQPRSHAASALCPAVSHLEEANMFSRILVAVDRSELSQGVFQKAVQVAKAMQAQMMILHVLSQEEPGAPEPPMILGVDYSSTISAELWQSYREQCAIFEQNQMDYLRSLVEKAAEHGIRAEYTLNYGNPGRVICDLARSWDADLVVVGRRGHSGLSELFLGSVSNYVLHRAPCSVLTIQGEALKKEAQTAEEKTATSAG